MDESFPASYEVTDNIATWDRQMKRTDYNMQRQRVRKKASKISLTAQEM